ncbi:hypothetical protein [Absidia glauca]|uniref:Nucleoplasmin-like domain-containing protein n=1 Tax=Absidia glauca TaxID=4829 RepID=A0A168PLI4_ABSGL|nr:hypothetical protein [Absidia glauca]
MATKVWGLTLSPDQNPVPLQFGDLKLTQASLAWDAKPGNTQLKIRSKNDEFILCTLSERVDQQKLNLALNEDMLDCTLHVTGVNEIVLTGQVCDDNDDDDKDFQPDENDDDDDEVAGMMQFRDLSDNRFLSGFELRHFGLGSPPLMPVYDNIDLRKEEKTPEDKSLQGSDAIEDSQDDIQKMETKS